MELEVVIPFVLPTQERRCCGLQGPKWQGLVRDAIVEEASHARRVLSDVGVRHSVTVAEGKSVPEIATAFAAEAGLVLALPETASGSPFSRRSLRRTEKLAAGPVRRLPPA
jgi:hypothetical protein